MGTGDSCRGVFRECEELLLFFQGTLDILSAALSGYFFRDVPVHIVIQIVTTEKRGCQILGLGMA